MLQSILSEGPIRCTSSDLRKLETASICPLLKPWQLVVWVMEQLQIRCCSDLRFKKCKILRSLEETLIARMSLRGLSKVHMGGTHHWIWITTIKRAKLCCLKAHGLEIITASWKTSTWHRGYKRLSTRRTVNSRIKINLYIEKLREIQHENELLLYKLI